MPKPIFWEKEKYFKMLSVEVFTQNAKHASHNYISHDTTPNKNSNEGKFSSKWYVTWSVSKETILS